MLRRALASRLLRALVGVGLLGFIVSRADLAEVARLFARGRTELFAGGLALLVLANPGLQALRLHILVVRYTQRLASTLRIFFISAFFNTLLPSNLGGDAIRLLELRRRHADNWGGPFALLLLHRVSGMAVLLVAGLFCALWSWERLRGVLRAAKVRVDAHLPWQVVAIAACVVVVLLLFWLRLSAGLRTKIRVRAQGFLLDCRQALAQIGPRSAVALLCATIAFHAARAFAFALLVRYAGQSIALGDVVLVLTVSAIAGVVPITIGGLGVVEGAITLMLSLFGVSGSAGLIVALANRSVLLASAAAGGLVYLAGKTALAPAEPPAPAGVGDGPNLSTSRGTAERES